MNNKREKKIVAIWAEDDRHLIGVKGSLPWHLPKELKAEGVSIVHSVPEALSWYRQQDKSLFIVGGASIYKAFESYYDKIIKTSVHGQFEGDTYFPLRDFSSFQEISQAFFEKDENNSHDFTVTVLEKKE